jgi:hypothetical protein
MSLDIENRLGVVIVLVSTGVPPSIPLERLKIVNTKDILRGSLDKTSDLSVLDRHLGKPDLFKATKEETFKGSPAR